MYKFLNKFFSKKDDNTFNLSDIVGWQVGDSLKLIDYDGLNYFRHIDYNFQHVTPDGTMIMSFFTSKEAYPAKLVLKYFTNTSLETRDLETMIKDTPEYMELLKEFDKALLELNKRK